VSGTRVRPLLPVDVEAARQAAFESLREAGTRYGWPTDTPTERSVARGRSRIAHLQRTDPDGAWVAERDGRVVGVALSLRRGPLWFLSLLAVDLAEQGRGLGARLLEAAERTADGARVALLCASSDPKALRRYGLSGFALAPSYVVTGHVDRSLLPALPGVREGSWDDDRDLVERVVTQQRGAPYGPDLDWLRDQGIRLLVTDGPRGTGYAGVGVSPGPQLLAATTPAAAQDLMWASLAEGEGDVEVEPVTGAQQWAVEVALAARLTLRPGSESLCVRGTPGPMSPYLPSGIFG
jgi:GNAT superfamily N-acetyltransferase